MAPKYLVCSDLDRTIIPNGEAPESPQARPLLGRVAGLPELGLAYVSGRNLRLLQEAVRDYGLPMPDYAVGDVGTTIYDCRNGGWDQIPAWHERIGADWTEELRTDIDEYLNGMRDIRAQEPENQGRFKLSYYAPVDIADGDRLAQIREHIRGASPNITLIWSIDEAADIGLIDILPATATKYQAVRFLMEMTGVALEQTVFAGDSGNDLPALTSGLNAVLVANAREEVKREAIAAAADKSNSNRLYIAKGDFLGMNGNYAAGLLEGVAHFLPELEIGSLSTGSTDRSEQNG